jgi:hypothetical protein
MFGPYLFQSTYSSLEFRFLRIMQTMLVSFPVLSKFMADSPSQHHSSDSNQPLPSETIDLFNVFPDCLIMWDDNSKARPSDASLPFKSAGEERSVQSQPPSPCTPRSPNVSVSDPAHQTNTQAIQYHVHYHPLGGNKLAAAFVAGGLLVFFGFLFASNRPQIQNLPESSEQAERVHSSING